MLIEGKKISEQIISGLVDEVKKMKKPPRLAAILVSSPSTTEAVKKFVEIKKRAAQKAGIDFKIYEFPETISNNQLRKEITRIAKSPLVDGVLVELPLPPRLNTQYLLNAIPEEKDIDVLSQKSQGSFFVGRSKILPPAVEAVSQIFKNFDIPMSGKKCAVFGYGLLVGRPISHWLMANDATVFVVNEYTNDPSFFSKQADIIISGVGKPGLITAGLVKDGAIVIDFGYENQEGRAVGDVDFDSVSKKTSLITPVPGGVGPIVVASVLKNLVELAKNHA